MVRSHEEQVDDLASLQQRLEIAIGQVLALGCKEHGLYEQQPQEGQDEVANGKFLLGGWHVFPSLHTPRSSR